MHHELTQINLKDSSALFARYDYVFIDDAVAAKYYAEFDGPKFLRVQNAEAKKNIQGFDQLTGWLLQSGVVRSSRALIVGGGALSDLAGFVCASVLRGISFDIMPTTLLGMIDASIGGKVGINTMLGKNLIGAFAFAKKIYICSEFLESLTPEQMQSGLGELSKYSILSTEVYRSIGEQPLSSIIEQCANYKMRIVAQDVTEKELRKILNLGHTMGHAFELMEQIPHGLAVAKGIVGMLSLYNPSLLPSYQSIMNKLGIVVEPPKGSFDQFVDYISKDKKRVSDGHIDIIVPKTIGSVEIKRINLNALLADVRDHEFFANLS